MAEMPQIIPAGPLDLPDIRQMAHAIWHAYYPSIISREQIDYMLERDYALGKLQADLDAGVRFEKLVLNQQSIGFCAYGPINERLEIKLHKIYLDPAYHGKGLGSLLLRHIDAECRGLGGKELLLQVNRRNLRAIRAYQQNGYRIQRDLVLDIGQGFVMDDHVMVKSLR